MVEQLEVYGLNQTGTDTHLSRTEAHVSEAFLLFHRGTLQIHVRFAPQQAVVAPSQLFATLLAVFREFVLEVLVQAISESCLACNMCLLGS